MVNKFIKKPTLCSTVKPASIQLGARVKKKRVVHACYKRGTCVGQYLHAFERVAPRLVAFHRVSPRCNASPRVTILVFNKKK